MAPQNGTKSSQTLGQPLAKMKLKQLAEELGARGAAKSGRAESALQLRPRALIIRAAGS